MGRSGRRREASVAILVAGAGAVDQFVATHPDYLFDSSPEEARLDPTNLHVLLAHVRAATFELPFDPGDSLSRRADRRPARLPGRGGPRPPGRRRPLVLGERELPGVGGVAAGRRAGERRDHRHDRASAAASSSARSTCSPRRSLVHDNAIYLHESRQYHVDHLDWEERKAYVKPVDVDYYTQALLAVTLKPLETFASAPAGAPSASTAR